MPTEVNALATILGMLDQLPLIGMLRTHVVAYVAVNAAHTLCLGLLLGTMLPLDLGVLRAPGFAWTVPVASPLRRLATAAFAGAAITGLLLFSVRPADYLGNDAFLIKLAAITIAGGNALVFERMRNPAVRFAQAGLSVGVWLSTLLAGRLIGFV
jgi:hypothetical protein